jgi:DNA-binding response OmpR family regulator
MQNVLVIDDDAALRDSIGLMLETEGFHPTLAKDGKAGIKHALAMKPDLVLVDLRMLGLAGSITSTPTEAFPRPRLLQLAPPSVLLNRLAAPGVHE